VVLAPAFPGPAKHAGAVDRVKITGCFCINNTSKGVDIFSGALNVLVDGCTLTGNGSDGVDYDGTQNIICNCII